jgi:MFS transporter, NNP family, nitrate/nitrite transporter
MSGASPFGRFLQSSASKSNTEFGLLVGTPFLSGSLMRVVLGVLADRYGGRRLFLGVMIFAAIATWLVAAAATFPMLLVAGLDRGWQGPAPPLEFRTLPDGIRKSGMAPALGIFGAGNAGSAITKLGAPWVMIAWGWQGVARLWALLLLVTAAIFFLARLD